MTTPGAELFGSGNLGCTRSATGVDVTGEGVPDTLLANGYDEGVDSTHKYRGPCAGGAAGRRGSVQVHVSAEYFAPVDRFTVLQGEGVAVGTPVALTQSLESVLNAGAGVEHWFGGVSADQGTRYGGTVVYGAFAIDQSASPDVELAEASTSNQNHYHVTAGFAFSIGSSRFSLGVSYPFGSKTRPLGLGGLPPQVPIIGEGVPADVKFSRWVFVLGHLFNH